MKIVSSSGYLDFCVLDESTSFKICDVIINITAYFLRSLKLDCFLESKVVSKENWSDILASSEYFQLVFTCIDKFGN